MPTNMHQFLWRERKTDVNLRSPMIHNPLASMSFFLYVYTGHVLTRDEIYATIFSSPQHKPTPSPVETQFKSCELVPMGNVHEAVLDGTDNGKVSIVASGN